MDLGATANRLQDEDYVARLGLDVPRLRGYRLMKDETPFSEKEIEEGARSVGKYYLNLAKDSGAVYLKGRHCHTYDKRQARGQARRAYRRQRKMLEAFNSYCGKNVLYVHARIGGYNWGGHSCYKLERDPRYLGRYDDGFDDTYCDIYFSLGE